MDNGKENGNCHLGFRVWGLGGGARSPSLEQIGFWRLSMPMATGL